MLVFCPRSIVLVAVIEVVATDIPLKTQKSHVVALVSGMLSDEPIVDDIIVVNALSEGVPPVKLRVVTVKVMPLVRVMLFGAAMLRVPIVVLPVLQFAPRRPTASASNVTTL